MGLQNSLLEHQRVLRAMTASHLLERLLDKHELSHVVLAGGFNASSDPASMRF